jgi:putative exporter of polyketide antibiotics
VSPASAVFRRALRDSRTRTLSFALLFAFATVAQATTYRSAYPALADRLELARTFGDNQGTRLLYGVPHDLLTTGGWMSWRLGALPVFAGLWGLFGAVRALRTEEESGRQELVLAGIARCSWRRWPRSARAPSCSGSRSSWERCPATWIRPGPPTSRSRS